MSLLVDGTSIENVKSGNISSKIPNLSDNKVILQAARTQSLDQQKLEEKTILSVVNDQGSLLSQMISGDADGKVQESQSKEDKTGEDINKIEAEKQSGDKSENQSADKQQSKLEGSDKETENQSDDKIQMKNENKSEDKQKEKNENQSEDNSQKDKAEDEKQMKAEIDSEDKGLSDSNNGENKNQSAIEDQPGEDKDLTIDGQSEVKNFAVKASDESWTEEKDLTDEEDSEGSKLDIVTMFECLKPFDC